MRPVYIAILKSLGFSNWNYIVVIPATNPVYEHFDTGFNDTNLKKA